MLGLGDGVTGERRRRVGCHGHALYACTHRLARNDHRRKRLAGPLHWPCGDAAALVGPDIPLLLYATEAGSASMRLWVPCRWVRAAAAGFMQWTDCLIARAPAERHEMRASSRLTPWLLATAARTARRVLRAGRALVSVDAGVIDGFAIRRTFGRGALIGPVVATTPEPRWSLRSRASNQDLIASILPSTNPR